MNIISLQQWIQDNGTEFFPLKDSVKYEYVLPKMYNKEGMWIFEEDRKKCGLSLKTGPQYLGITKNLYCCSDGSIKTPEIILEGFTEHNEQIFNVRELSNGLYVNLVDRWAGTNYWHWLTTSFGRLAFLQKMPNFTSFNDYHYIVNSFDNNFTRQSLQKIGIDSKRCMEIGNAGSSFFCKDLIILSKVYDGDIDPVLFVRNNFRPVVNRNISKKIYITRNNSRKINNEYEVSAALKRRGFITIRCEELSLNEQVSFFSDASVVVGVHGAGMSNIMFASEAAKILEIRNQNYTNNCYLYLAMILGFDYYNLYGIDNKIDDFKQCGGNTFGNITVDIKELENTLDMMEV